MFEHLKGSFHFWWYHAPCNQWHDPRVVEPDIEEIEVIVAGRGYFESDGCKVDAGPGSALWYGPGDVVAVRSHEKDPYETIVFRFDVKGPPASKAPWFSEWTDPGECIRFARHAKRMLDGGIRPGAWVAACHYARLFGEAMEFVRREKDDKAPLVVSAALRFIESRFSGQIGVEDVARAAGISTPHLHAVFRKHTGLAPMQFVIRRRIMMARDLLGRGDCTVKEACHACGFRDVKYFSRRFHEETSLTPGEYRRRMKGE